MSAGKKPFWTVLRHKSENAVVAPPAATAITCSKIETQGVMIYYGTICKLSRIVHKPVSHMRKAPVSPPVVEVCQSLPPRVVVRTSLLRVVILITRWIKSSVGPPSVLEGVIKEHQEIGWIKNKNKFLIAPPWSPSNGSSLGWRRRRQRGW